MAELPSLYKENWQILDGDQLTVLQAFLASIQQAYCSADVYVVETASWKPEGQRIIAKLMGSYLFEVCKLPSMQRY